MTDVHEIDRELLMAWVDGELAPAEARDIAAHVERCVSCRDLAADLRDVSARVATWAVPAAPATLRAPGGPAPANEVRATTARGLWSSFDPSRWSHLAAAAAVIGVIALGASMQMSMRSDAPQDMTIETDMVAQQSEALPNAAALPMSPPSMPRYVDSRTSGRQEPAGAETRSDAPMIARSATIALLVEKFEDARLALDRLMRAHSGSIGHMEVNESDPSRRSLSVTVRVPAARLDAVLAELRLVGKVDSETQSSVDITNSFRDLSVRLANARIAEQRLRDLLARRTGDLKDVLAVEEQVMRVRTQIEQMEAEVRSEQGRVAQSSISMLIREVYRAEKVTEPESLRTSLKNAFVDGTRGALTSLREVVLGLLTMGPTLILWSTLIGLPVWLIVRRARRESRAVRTPGN